MNPEEKKRYFERGGTVIVHFFLKPPGKSAPWSNAIYRDGFNVFCNNNGSGGEPRLRSMHLPPTVALAFAEMLDTMIGTDASGFQARTVREWVSDSYDLMPGALDEAIRDAERHVASLRQIRSALTGRY